jgi:DHA2 family multidrug resistance protein
MRNLGGAIGIAVIDTIIFTRAPEIANSLVSRLGNGDMAAAQALRLRPDELGAALMEPGKQAMLAPLIKQIAYVNAINEAWAVMGVATLAVLVIVPLARRVSNANSERKIL